MWDLPRPQIELVSLALRGGFLTAEPPGKLYSRILFIHSTYNSLHLLIPNSQYILPQCYPPPRHLGNHKSVPDVCRPCTVLIARWESRAEGWAEFRIAAAVAAAAKSLQSCLTLCDPIDGSPPTRLPRPWDSPGKNTGVGCHFLLQCMTGKVRVKSLSHVQLLATPWTAAHQTPPSMGFSRWEHWSGLPLPSPWEFLVKVKTMIQPTGLSNFLPFSSAYRHWDKLQLQTSGHCWVLL